MRKYNNFKKSAQTWGELPGQRVRDVRKSADAYSRASTSRTGVLDCSKLHTYKYNEDLFKKVTVIPDGKNHGLIFILDWSGSMCWPVSKILSNNSITWFGSVPKFKIPFEVYAFTSSVIFDRDRYENQVSQRTWSMVSLLIDEWHSSLMNILTSKVNKKTSGETDEGHLYRLVYSLSVTMSGYDFPPVKFESLWNSSEWVSGSSLSRFSLSSRRRTSTSEGSSCWFSLMVKHINWVTSWDYYSDYFNGES